MRINGQSIANFGAQLLSFEIQAAQDEPMVEWLPQGLLPVKGSSTLTFGSANAVLYFRGSDPSRITQNIAMLLALLGEEAFLRIPGYAGEYVAYLTTSNIEKILRSKTRRKLTLTFKGFLRGEKQIRTFQGITQAKLLRVGTRPTPVRLIIEPQSFMEDFSVEGLTDGMIYIRNLNPGVQIVIDGRDATAWAAGQNKTPDVTMWEPPALRKPETTLVFSNPEPKVTIEYYPIWM